jgi:hypothetical protein
VINPSDGDGATASASTSGTGLDISTNFDWKDRGLSQSDEGKDGEGKERLHDGVRKSASRVGGCF